MVLRYSRFMRKTALPVVLLCCFLVFAPARAVEAGELVPAEFPSLLSVVRNLPAVDFCGEAVPLDNPEVRERFEKEVLLMLGDRAQTILWLKRSGRYFPHIESVLRLNNMPEDLKYLAVIESALRPHVGSHKGARGYWQFIPSTGKKFGLEVDRDRDERRSFLHSTRAAAEYLKELHGMFGKWTLAAAAYNMGEAGLKKDIEVQGTDDFFNLYLPLETQRYVIRAAAVKMILENPQKFGFDMREEDYYKPVQFDRVTIVCRHRTSVRIVADAAQTTFKTIKDMNPEVRGDYFERGTHTVLIPRGAARGFAARFVERVKTSPQVTRERYYVVKKGDSLSIIAEKLGISLRTLIKLNKLTVDKPIRPGQKLIIE